MIKTKLVNLPIDLAEQERIIAYLFKALQFTTALDLYSSNRKKEDNFNDIAILELNILRKEAQLKLLTEEYNAYKGGSYREGQEANGAIEQQEVLPYQEELYDKLEDIAIEVLKYRKQHKHIAQVDNLFLLDAEMAYFMFLSLAVGIRFAADYLAICFDKGYGVVKNEFLAYLCVAVGHKLTRNNIIAGINNDNISDQVKELADKCVVQIQQNAMKLGERRINYQEAIGIAKNFDNIVKTSSGMSFEKYIVDSWIKEHAQFVVPIDGNNKIIPYQEMLEERLSVGQKYIEQKLYTEALNIFDELISKGEEKAFIYMNALRYKAECLYKLGKFPEALDCYNKISQISPNEHNWGRKASCLWKMTKCAEAYQYSEEGLALDNTDTLCLSIKIDCFILIGKYEEAIEYCEELLKIEYSVYSLQQKAACLIRLAKFYEAFEVIESALAFDPTNVTTVCFEILFQYCLGQYEDALSSCSRAAIFASNELDKKIVLEYRILLLNKLSRYDEALTCQINLLMMNLRNKNSLAYRGFSLNQTGAPEVVIKHLENAIKLDPQNKKIALNLALIYVIQLERIGKKAEALENMDRALELMHHNSKSKKLAVVYKAHILNTIGRYEEAIKYCDEAINIDADYILAWEEKGLAYSSLGNKDESEKIYAAIKSKADPDQKVNKERGVILYFSNNTEKQKFFTQPETIDS